MQRSTCDRLLASIVAAVLGLGLVACGVSSPPVRGIASPAATAPAATSSAVATAGTAAPPSHVSLALSKARYMPTDAIVVTIHNGLAISIFAQDNHSDCTLVEVERLMGGLWQGQNACVNMRPAPHVIEIKPGVTITLQLRSTQGEQPAPQWSAGTYRIAFAYVTGPNQPFGQSTILYSASFAIG